MDRTKRTNRINADNKEPGAAGSDILAGRNDLAGHELTQESPIVVMQFAERANRGDAKSLDTLAGLEEPSSAGHAAESDRIGFSQALVWTEEPEWQGESSEAEAETATGSRQLVS